jgi:NADH-quinone oxidoreductase subunit A
MFVEYIYIFIALFIAIFLGIFIYCISFFFVQKNLDLEKISIYECGFEPFDHTQNVFEVKFYLVAILFVIFDLEIIYLFSWVLVYKMLGFFGLLSMVLFLFILGLVYIYEWLLGASEW